MLWFLYHNLRFLLPLLPSLLLIVQSSGGVLQKKCLQISQNSQENTCAKDSLLMKLQIYSFSLSKKRFRHRFFLVNSAKFFITLFCKEPSDGCVCITTYSPATTFYFFKKDVIHIFRLRIFSTLFIDLRQE